MNIITEPSCAAKTTNKHNTCGKAEEQMKKTKQAGDEGHEDDISIFECGVSIVKRNGDCIQVDEKTAEIITRFLATRWDNDCIGLLAGANGDSYQIRAHYCCDHEDEVDRNEKAGNPGLMGMEWHLGDYCQMVNMFRADESLACIADVISRTPMEVCCKLTETGLVNDVEAQYLKSLVTFSAPASLSVLNREPVAA